jgi:hypothetical protein
MLKQYKGRLLSSIEPTTNTSFASGMWALEEQMQGQAAGAWPVAAGGGGGGGFVSVNDVFSTTLYAGNSGSQTINNGLNLSGQGGLVWLKERTSSGNNPSHWLFDSIGGATTSLTTNNASGRFTGWGPGVPFSSTGFSVGNIQFNTSGANYASWAFRKAPRFFDVVTWNGTGAVRDIPHSLGVSPGMIVIKKTSDTQGWTVYHRSVGSNSNLILNTTAGAAFNSGIFPRVISSSFGIDYVNDYNASGSTYIAYIFAHDSAVDGIVQCGSFSSTGFVNLGWEPQWIIMKSTTDTGTYTGDWRIFDYKRGITVNGDDAQLFANDSRAENTGNFGTAVHFNSTGFTVEGQGNYGTSTVYMAIRR